MKKALLALVFLSTNSAFAAAPLCPYLEGQIFAVVRSVTPVSEKKMPCDFCLGT